MSVVLVGAGGHAKAVVEALRALGKEVAAYVDPRRADWLEARHLLSDEVVRPDDGEVVLGLGGVSPARLEHRLALLDLYLERGFRAPPVVHPAAYVSPGAELGAATIVLAGAVVQPAAGLERGVIVNTGAIIEHDSTIGPGAHIAPGAIVLGGCRVGCCAMIGAGAVMLPRAVVAERTLLPAATVAKGSKSRRE